MAARVMIEAEVGEATTVIDASAVAAEWLGAFEAATAQGDISAVLALFSEDCWWRDWLAVTWNLRTMQGPDAIGAVTGDRLADVGFRDLVLRDQIPASVDDGALMAAFEFKTNVAAGRGIVRLRNRNGVWQAWTLFTIVDELIHHPERGITIDDWRRPEDRDPGETWYEYRSRTTELAGHEPDVVVVGAGHSGLAITARLAHLGLATLLVEQTARIGDVWRDRYNNLSLHDTKWFSEMPYMPYPDNWPVFIPKELVADWFETYALHQQLNVWTSTEVMGAAYDDDTQRWTVELSRNGAPRIVCPRHLVFATGAHAGAPEPPPLPGRASFAGEVVHSSGHEGGPALGGKRVIVVGVGSSGFDVAQDAYLNGATEVTIVQRSPIPVVSSENVVQATRNLFSESGPPIDDADLIFYSLPWPVILSSAAAGGARKVAEFDAKMLAGLNRAGLRTSLGPGDTGLIGQSLLREGSGYYIDKGCSQLIIDGKVNVQQGEITSFTQDGVVFSDGSSALADVVVFSTGFPNMRDFVRPIVGDSLADTLSPIWRLDDEGEFRGIYRPSGHPRLWFAAGGFPQSRPMSRLLAIQIKAAEEKLTDIGFSQASNGSATT